MNISTLLIIKRGTSTHFPSNTNNYLYLYIVGISILFNVYLDIPMSLSDTLELETVWRAPLPAPFIHCLHLRRLIFNFSYHIIQTPIGQILADHQIRYMFSTYLDLQWQKKVCTYLNKCNERYFWRLNGLKSRFRSTLLYITLSQLPLYHGQTFQANVPKYGEKETHLTSYFNTSESRI